MLKNEKAVRNIAPPNYEALLLVNELEVIDTFEAPV